MYHHYVMMIFSRFQLLFTQSKLLEPTASGSGRVQASKTSSVMMTKSKKIEPEKNTKTEAKPGNKIVRTHTAVAKMESTVSLLEHVEYALPPPR